MHIYWTEFDWPSFATLATGAAAVVGATLVGLKQAGIARRQADITERQVEIAGQQNAILSRQTAIEEIRLRTEVYERRIEVYEQVRTFTDHVMMHGDARIDAEYINFTRAVMKAEFLFSPEVIKEVRAFGHLCFEFSATSFNIKRAVDRNEVPSPELYRDQSATISAIFAFSSRMPDIFRKDLQLTEMPTSTIM
jgi:hypothetical protein